VPFFEFSSRIKSLVDSFGTPNAPEAIPILAAAPPLRMSRRLSSLRISIPLLFLFMINCVLNIEGNNIHYTLAASKVTELIE
jgi:hypothetical protein